MKIFDIFQSDKKHRKGLLPLEWIVVAYTLLTTLWILFAYTELHNPVALLLGRAKVMLIMGAMWLVYRLLPCRLVMLVRVGVQMALLAWWYPDTYELNRFLPNLDHLFAAYDQALFGFQPALRFSQWAHWPLVSELMDMGYASYYPMMVVVLLFYFFCRYKEFQQCATILIGSFFIYYVVFDFLPVVGPTFYYKAVGLESIAQGVFPALGDYFNTHQACLPSPGYTDGIFYQAVEQAKAAGERPTAAFPSSHVGISTICMLLAWHSRQRKLVWFLLPFYVLLCFATVYIQAHYAVDALAGLLTGGLIYLFFRLFLKS